MKLAHCKLCVLLCCFTATSALTYANSGSKGVSMEITQQKNKYMEKSLMRQVNRWPVLLFR